MECYGELAKVYDKLINSDIDYKMWSEFIINKCNMNKIKMDKCLDLACGTGNFTYEFINHFNKVWAVDLSEEMLMQAQDKFKGSLSKKVKLINQDMTKLNLNEKFNLITCCLDSTNYLLDVEEIKKYFENVHNHLDDEGIFVFDINSHYKLTNVLGNNTFTYDDNEVVYIWENYVEESVLNMDLTFFIKNGQDYKRFDESHMERAYEDYEIENFLKNANLSVLQKLDNYTEKHVDSRTERIVYIVKKSISMNS